MDSDLHAIKFMASCIRQSVFMHSLSHDRCATCDQQRQAALFLFNMAEGTTITKMKESLKCGVCLEIYTDPKQLQCRHIFCLKCLRALVVPHQNSLTCPTCRVVTPLPTGGVAFVPSAFQITPFLELIGEHKSATSTSSMSSVVKAATVTYCTWHPDKELEFYCETCGLLICYKCALKGGSHRNHDYKEIAEAFEVYKKDISSAMAPMEETLTTINKTVTKLDKLRSEIVSRRVATKSKINDTATKLHQNIDARKEELTTQVDQITEQKLKELDTKIHQVKAIQGKYTCSLDSMKKSLKSKSHKEVLQKKADTIKKANEIASSFQPTVLEPPVESDVLFLAATDICTSHGQIVKCSIVGDVPSKATVGQPCTVTLRASSVNGGECDDISKSIDCEFLSDRARKDKVSVHKSRGNDYKITYTTSIEGNYQLHIGVGGHHISGSPFAIAVFKREYRRHGASQSLNQAVAFTSASYTHYRYPPPGLRQPPRSSPRGHYDDDDDDGSSGTDDDC